MKRPLLFYLLIFSFFTGLGSSSGSTANDTSGEMILNQGRMVDSPVESVIPFSWEANMIVINAEINDSGKTYRFLVDTGASTIVVTHQLAAELGLKKLSQITGSDNYTTQTVDIVTINRLTAGKATVENCGAVVATPEIFTTLQIDGIIGYNFLKYFKLQIDYEQHIITLSRPQIQTKSSFQVKLFLKEGLIGTLLKMAPDTPEMEAFIDTGAGGSHYLTIPNKLREQYELFSNCRTLKSKGSSGGGAFGQSPGELGRLDSVGLGNFGINNLPVIFDDSERANIGSKFLSHFKVVIDYAELEMYLIPIASKRWDTNVFSYGFGLEREPSGKIQIRGLWEGSPADQAGLKPGDEIVKASTGAGMALSYADLTRLFYSKNNQTIKLLIKNEAGEREVFLDKALLLPELAE